MNKGKECVRGSFTGIGQALGIGGKVLDDVIPEKNGGRGILNIRPPGKDDAPPAYRGGNGKERDVFTRDAMPCDFGNEGNTKSGADEFPHGIRAVALKRNPRRKSGRMAVHIGNGTETLSRLEHDEASFTEVAEIHRRKRCPGIGIRHGEQDFFFQKGTGTFVIPGTDGREEGEIHRISVFLLVVNFLLENFQMDVWVKAAEIHEEAGNEFGRGEEGKTHGRLERPFHGGKFLARKGQFRHNAFCVAQKNFSIPGEDDIPPAPFKERYAELRLEGFHGSREGRMGNMQLLCRPGEMLLFRNFLEVR